jgi:hypothetical protein
VPAAPTSHARPSTPEIDGYTLELGPAPTGPTEDEARWAAQNLNDDYHTEEDTPDYVYDRRAEEALARDRIESGFRPF